MDTNETYASTAASLPQRSTPSTSDSKEFISKIDFTKNCHSYKLNKLPPNGFTSFMKHAYPSISMIMPRSTMVLGKFHPSLALYFDSDKPTFDKDFEATKKFSIKIGDATIFLDAVDENETNGGHVVPRIVKTIFADRVPLPLLKNIDVLAKALEPYATIDTDKITILQNEGIFSGQAIIPVKEYTKRIPPRTFKVPFTNFDGTTVDECFDQILLNCRGIDLKDSSLTIERNPRPKCPYCSGDHRIVECPTRPDPCKTCGVSMKSSGCTFSKCLKISDITSGQFPSLKNNPSRSRKSSFSNTYGSSKRRRDSVTFNGEQLSNSIFSANRNISKLTGSSSNPNLNKFSFSANSPSTNSNASGDWASSDNTSSEQPSNTSTITPETNEQK